MKLQQSEEEIRSIGEATRSASLHDADHSIFNTARA